VIGFLARRAVGLAATLAGALIVVFLMVRIVPGDPALLFLGEDYSPDAYAAVRRALDLDRPLPAQLAEYLRRVSTGDFGVSFRTHQAVLQAVWAQFSYTLVLALSSLALAVGLGVPVGIFSALRRGRWADHLTMLVAVAGVTMPSFLVAILFMLWFSLDLDWLPSIGAGDFAQPLTVVTHLILPAAVLGLSSAALIARLTRSTMLEVLGQDFLRTARAKGLSGRRVVRGHALPNAMTPILTIVGIDLGRLLAGTTVIEIVFGRPGIGHLLIDAMRARDYPQIQGTMLFYIALIVVANTVVDVSYALVDPRVRFG